MEFDHTIIITCTYTHTHTMSGTPKGVMLSHNSLLHNLEMMKQIMKTDNSMVEISFLPHFHDMGLICSYLQPLYHGGTGYFMSPSTFIQNPGLWLKAFSMYKGTHAKAPNYAFELVLKKGFPDNLDLSSAHYLVNGSEPVYAETIQRFESALAPYGLKRNTVHAGYGLAEHTMYLCGVWDKEDFTVANGRISCGQPTAGVTVKVVDPDSLKEVPVGEEGEIWVSSESKAIGYWEKKEETQKVFEARLDNFSDLTYLRTGDLGFIKNGEVFISGQLHDLIIFNGRKIHPNDIEMRIESSFYALRCGKTVACQLKARQLKDGSKMQITYVAELRYPKGFSTVEFQSLAMKITSIISLDFQVQVEAVVFIQPCTLPLTTLGKRQRTLCKHMLLKKTLKVVYHWSRATAVATVDEIQASAASDTSPPKPKDEEKVHPPRRDQMMLKPKKSSTSPLPMQRKSLHTITDRMSDVLGIQLQPDSNIWEYGCNSVKAVQLSQCLQSEYGFAIEPHLLFTHQTPLALMGKLQRSLLSVTSHPPSYLEKNSNACTGANIVSKGNHGKHQKREILLSANVNKEMDKEGADEQEHSTPASSTDVYISPEEKAVKYLKEHKIIELFNNILSEMFIKRPEDPKAFIREYIKQLLKAKADPDNMDPPCMFEESNIKSVFFMLDLNKKGYISLNQYLLVMDVLRLNKFNQKPAGSEFDKISLETFVQETKAAFRDAYSTYKDS